MDLGGLLDRAQALEERTAALYRRFAAQADAATPLFRRLAAEEGAHAQSIAAARAATDPVVRWRVSVDGWNDALEEVAARVAAGEALPADAPLAARLAAALDIELSEIEELRQRLLGLTGQTVDAEAMDTHAGSLATAAAELTGDPHVGMQAALLRAQGSLARHA